MAKVKVDFEVTPSAGVQAYWIAVNADDVPLNNGKGSAMVESGVTSILVWWFIGNPGDTLAIVGKRGNTTVVELKESTIPDDRSRHAGFKPFKA